MTVIRLEVPYYNNDDYKQREGRWELIHAIPLDYIRLKG